MKNHKMEQLKQDMERALCNRPLTEQERIEHNKMVHEFNARQAELVRLEEGKQ